MMENIVSIMTTNGDIFAAKNHESELLSMNINV